jgi:23S rRNA pseudouridine2605 synthase
MPGIKLRMAQKTESTAPGDRIAKVMARAGLCSRREAEAWIAQGRVSVNGAVIDSPALNVTAQDTVAVDGKPLPARERTRLFLYHKPRGLVTTHADPEKRPTIFEKLPKTLPRVVSVGRLDLNTEGLLLLTNDGGLARVLELPATGWLRRYRVRAHGSILQPQLDALRKGVTVDGVRYGAIEASVDRMQGANVWLTFAIREGKNREVRNVLEHLGLRVNRLIRVSFGPFQLGDLPEGAVEEVRTRHLREQLGERIAKDAEADFTGPMTGIIPPPIAGEGRTTERAERREDDRGAGRRPGGKSRERKEDTPSRSPSATPLPQRKPDRPDLRRKDDGRSRKHPSSARGRETARSERPATGRAKRDQRRHPPKRGPRPSRDDGGRKR